MVEVELDFERRYRLVREVFETIVLILLMLLITRQALQNFHVDGMSMEPNLHHREFILVDKWSYVFHNPARGDVIVFRAPIRPTHAYIKRIIGLPGDVITIRGTRIMINGHELQEPYIDITLQGNPYASFVNRQIPPGTYFVLGDNRNGSSDSRDWGCVPRHLIVGRATLVYWPLGEDNNGLLPNMATVFSPVPTTPPPTLAPLSTCSVAGSLNA